MKSTSFLNINKALLVKRMLQGTGVNLILFFTFVWTIGTVENWLYLPLLSITIAGACGGILFYAVNDLLFDQHSFRFFIKACCLFVQLLTFWLSLVYGLSLVGLWN